MENIIYLNGKVYVEDKAIIENSIKLNPIFIYKDEETELWQYIDFLHDECDLKNKYLFRLKICKEVYFPGLVSLYSEKKEEHKPANMGELLKQIDEKSKWHLVIENNDRTLLANIVQQLVYISYPITNIDVKLRSEYKDAAKTALFMKHIEGLSTAAIGAVEALSSIKIGEQVENGEELLEKRKLALEAYEKISEQIEKAKSVEMKVAVAASKKTGKSVIANCMFGMELAPTSLELATPNSCIYRKSQDDKYHLIYDGHNEIFNSPQQVFNRVRKEFRDAQIDANAEFTIPNMEIEYVSNGNNFESYTIYDTPGPDAAGTNHRESAMKAIEECDVAIFAIDYSKYLTDTEEEYLNDIKKIFEQKHKFHTLIFDINKMDLALSDKGTKSRVKSIDFIRCRLKEIDKQYSDCVIFATSAQDYFYTLELLNASEKEEKCKQLVVPEADLYNLLRNVKDELEFDECEDEELITLLSNLDSEVSRVKSQLGYKNVTMSTIQNYSGIPQLMDYVSYIAKSKAREEIVNSITYTIDEQCKQLQVIIDYIENVEKLIGMSEEEIFKIKEILDAYAQGVGEVLDYNLNKRDIAFFNKNGYFAANITQMKKGNEGQIQINRILEEARNKIKKPKYQDFEKDLWEIVKLVQKKKLLNASGKKVTIESFEISKKELEDIIKGYIERETNDVLNYEKDRIMEIINDLDSIIKGRLEIIGELTKECQDKLSKNDYQLQLPSFPAFDVALPQIGIKKNISGLGTIDIHNAISFAYKPLSGVSQFFRNLFMSDHDMDCREVKVKKMSEDEAEQYAKNIKDTFDEGLDKADTYGVVGEQFEELKKVISEAQNQVVEDFEEINRCCKYTVNLFKSSIDDSAYYRNQIEKLNNMKWMIFQIEKASEEFLKIWNQILEG